MSPDSSAEAIRDEISNVEEAAKWSAQNQFEQAKVWRAAHLLLGVPAAGLAAVAGATALASTTGRLAAGIIALVSAGLGAVAAALDTQGRADEAETAGNAYLALQTRSRVARTVDLLRQHEEASREILSELNARQAEINAQASVVSKYAYWRAGKNIEGGGQTYLTESRPRP